MTGRKGLDCPNDTDSPCNHVTASPRRWRNSYTSRDLPIPASPTTKTTWPRPARAAVKAWFSMARASSRPTKGDRPCDARAARRVTCDFGCRTA